jgi:hypothetical protein
MIHGCIKDSANNSVLIVVDLPIFSSSELLQLDHTTTTSNHLECPEHPLPDSPLQQSTWHNHRHVPWPRVTGCSLVKLEWIHIIINTILNHKHHFIDRISTTTTLSTIPYCLLILLIY